MVHRRGGGYQQVPSREEEQAQLLPATGTHQSAPKSFRIADYKLDDTDADLQPHRIPYGSVALAVFLMLFGMVSFVLAWLHYTQQILGKEAAEIGFTVLGLVTFVPGFYHTRIAYYAWKGYKGFSWDDIPAYD